MRRRTRHKMMTTRMPWRRDEVGVVKADAPVPYLENMGSNHVRHELSSTGQIHDSIRDCSRPSRASRSCTKR